MLPIDLKDKVMWVTGGNRGIGRAVALAAAEAGAHVGISYRTRSKEASEVIDLIKAKGRKAVAVATDVGDKSSCESSYQKITEQLGSLDVLVNNAGLVRDNLFAVLEDADWQSVLQTNLMGVVHTCQTVIRPMMGKRSGRIINLSSAAGTKGGRGQSNYAASKGAVEAFTRSLAVEIGRRGVTVNCIAPGVIATEMSAEVRKLGHEEIMSRQVIKRYGEPHEIAAMVCYLASPFGDYITGQTFHIDGGLKMA